MKNKYAQEVSIWTSNIKFLQNPVCSFRAKMYEQVRLTFCTYISFTFVQSMHKNHSEILNFQFLMSHD